MNRIYISYTSIGYKILSLCFSILFWVVTIVFYNNKNQVRWYHTLFCLMLFIIFFFTTYLCFNNKIIIDKTNKYICYKSIKSKIIQIKDIVDIKIDVNFSIDPKKYCFVIFVLRDGSIFKIPEYSTLLKNKAVAITNKKIEQLLNEINQLK